MFKAELINIVISTVNQITIQCEKVVCVHIFASIWRCSRDVTGNAFCFLVAQHFFLTIFFPPFQWSDYTEPGLLPSIRPLMKHIIISLIPLGYIYNFLVRVVLLAFVQPEVKSSSMYFSSHIVNKLNHHNIQYLSPWLLGTWDFLMLCLGQSLGKTITMCNTFYSRCKWQSFVLLFFSVATYLFLDFCQLCSKTINAVMQW